MLTVTRETEWIRALEVPQKIADCFKPPYSKAAAWKDEWRSQPKRNLVFVGHDARQDNEALQKNGYDPSNLSNLVDVADTAHMFQSLTRSPQLSKLSNVLQSVGLSGYNFHNAGNDAAYTMQAMIGIAIKSAAEKEDRKAAKRDDLLKRLHHAMNNAVEVAKEGQEGWSSDDSDGGEAPPPFEPLVEKQKADIEAAPVETDAKPPNKDVTMGKGVCIPDQNGHPIPADGGNVMDKPSWRSQALTAKVEVKPISEPVQMVVIPKPVVKSNPYAELEAEDSDNVYTSNMLSQEMIDADFDMGYDPDNDKQEEPTQDDFPLQCTICPKSPWFPTIDNLYAHLGSKNHLKHRHDIDLVAKHDKAARKLLTEYELWYARNKLYDKLADRAAKNLITGPPTVNKETGKVTTGVTPPKPALKKSDKDVLMPLSQASVGKETLSTQTGASAEPAGKSAAKENPDNDTKNLEAERTTVMSGQTDGGNNEKRPVTRRCTRFIRRVEEKRDE